MESMTHVKMQSAVQAAMRLNEFQEKRKELEFEGTLRNEGDEKSYDQQPSGHARETGLELTRRSSSIGIALMKDVAPSGLAMPTATERKTFMMDASGAPTNIQKGGATLPYRPMVGAGAAAAYEALRDDFYIQKQKRERQKKRRMSSLSMGSAKARLTWKPAHPEEQYEMLKLHHLNLMNEIQETELMINLYEQQQLAEERKAKMRQIDLIRDASANSARPAHIASSDVCETDQGSKLSKIIAESRQIGQSCVASGHRSSGTKHLLEPTSSNTKRPKEH